MVMECEWTDEVKKIIEKNQGQSCAGSKQHDKHI